MLSRGHPSVQHPHGLGTDPAPTGAGTKTIPGDAQGRIRPCLWWEGSSGAAGCWCQGVPLPCWAAPLTFSSPQHDPHCPTLG